MSLTVSPTSNQNAASSATNTRRGLTVAVAEQQSHNPRVANGANNIKLSRKMVQAEPWVIGTSLLIPLLGSAVGKVSGQENNRLFNPSILTPASNIILSLFAAVGYQASMPLAGLGNYLFIIQELLRINPSTLAFGNAAFAFLPSALIGAAWGADSDKKASEKISKEKGIWNKLTAQLQFTKEYWTKEVPDIFKNLNTKLPKFMREVKEKPLERIGRTDKHFIMFHSMSSLIATVFLLTGMASMYLKMDDILRGVGLDPKNPESDPDWFNKTTKVEPNFSTYAGWGFGIWGTIPLIFFTMVNGFNKHINQKYGSFGKLLPITSIVYGITALVGTFMKPLPNVAIFTDFIRHAASSTFGHLKRRGSL